MKRIIGSTLAAVALIAVTTGAVLADGSGDRHSWPVTEYGKYLASSGVPPQRTEAEAIELGKGVCQVIRDEKAEADGFFSIGTMSKRDVIETVTGIHLMFAFPPVEEYGYAYRRAALTYFCPEYLPWI